MDMQGSSTATWPAPMAYLTNLMPFHQTKRLPWFPKATSSYFLEQITCCVLEEFCSNANQFGGVYRAQCANRSKGGPKLSACTIQNCTSDLLYAAESCCCVMLGW